MSIFKKAATIFLTGLACQNSIMAAPALVGYYTNWAQYRQAPGNYTPQSLNPILAKLSDVNYAFVLFNYQSATKPAGVTNDWQVHFSEWNDDANLKQVVALAKAQNVNVYASVGGWNFNTNDPTIYGHLTYTFFSQMVADPAKYQPFTASCIALCQTYGLKGIDLDWEFPGVPDRGGSASDYQNFVNFMAYFSAQLHGQGLKVTAAIPAFAPAGFTSGNALINSNNYVISTSNPQSYVDWLSGISQYFDAYNLMSYDYNGAWPGATVTGENSPLQPLTPGAQCIVTSVNNLLHNQQYPSQSTSASKIIVGLATYGRTFGGVTFPSSLANQPFGPGASFQYPGGPGYYSGQSGMLSYYEILGNFKTNFYEGTEPNPVTQTAYAWGQQLKTWVSYDSANTASLKAKYIMENNLGGAMIYTLDFDNFFDVIGPYALTNEMAESLGR
jgi:GH18 family chitinase